ncbi:MAG: hypothetical protein J6M43_02995 [Neisseriaceae bacterium]|nr:hypothetical protein [Neisseriaceae bacterium]
MSERLGCLKAISSLQAVHKHSVAIFKIIVNKPDKSQAWQAFAHATLAETKC